MVTLRYGERHFLRKAKEIIKRGETLSITFCGWRGNLVARRISFLKEIESAHDHKDRGGPSAWKFLLQYLPLIIVLTPFMVVFWLAMAYGRNLKVVKNIDETVEIVF